MNFTELEVWKKSRVFRNQIFQLVKSFPTEEKYSLTSQIVRSSRSITANIAEGHGRYHLRENMQFCRTSRGSLSETLDHLICARDCGYVSESDFENLKLHSEEILRLLNGYIAYLKKQLDK